MGIEAPLQDENVDIVMPWFVFQNAPLHEDIVDILGNLNHSCDKPILCGAFGGAFTHQIGERVEKRGVSVYYSVREWMAAASGLVLR